MRFGGFPEPFYLARESFYNRWQATWRDQVLREEVRDLTRVQELSQIEYLAIQIQHQAGQLSSYSTFARNVRCAVDTVRRWIEILESLYYCFRISPWYANVVRGLRKEPKYYLWDWSMVPDSGARAENFVACALLKAVHWWTEIGFGDHSLHFVRDKQKREVDFVIVKDSQPWFLVEVKSTKDAPLSAHLKYFQEQIGARHAFQVALDAEFIGRNCFEVKNPIIVPAKTLLAQLI